MLHELLEVALGRLEGVLEGRLDLGVGLADQAGQLPERALEVGALCFELLDVLERLGVLALRKRVDGAELLATTRKPLELELDLIALVVGE
jgi:hypothetical protein